MIRKTVYIAAAWISLMLKRSNQTNDCGLKECLFKRNEIIEEAEKMLKTKKITNGEFESTVVGSGSSLDKYLKVAPKGSLSEYYYLNVMDNQINQNYLDFIDVLIEHAEYIDLSMNRAEVVFGLERYISFVLNFNWPIQMKYTDMIARDAVWLAAAALTYNDWVRDIAREEKEFWYRQRTIANTAICFNERNSIDTCRQMARKDCTLGKSNQGYTYFTADGKLRRLTRISEADDTIPNCPNDYEIVTIMGSITAGELKRFVKDRLYIERVNYIEPLEIENPIEQQYQHALQMDDISLYHAAILRSNMDRELITIQTNNYYRDPYIARFAKKIARGTCQLCKKPAPFLTIDGEPYLESHHIEWLSDGGKDTIDNVIALCPNCHRKMHALNLYEDKLVLIERVKEQRKTDWPGLED